MYMRNSRFIALLMLIVGVMLTLHASTRADPTQDKCTDKCVERTYFIDSPGLNCYSYTPASCERCVAGRCLLPASTNPTCKDQLDRTRFITYEAGTCTPKCNLNLNSSSEASQPTGEITADVMITLWLCQ